MEAINSYDYETLELRYHGKRDKQLIDSCCWIWMVRVGVYSGCTNVVLLSDALLRTASTPPPRLARPPSRQLLTLSLYRPPGLGQERSQAGALDSYPGTPATSFYDPQSPPSAR